ncbi:ATP phosphoribosyltransferase [Epilithonimonas ginsengisoli]|uniref:ATP phosphoribosyltransferase n=1 Tax=Epilithonimonas ginsengisoli TaxID=1245592 RepID=A0ABU4JCZ0_9FLAO|nr:MULTISPECIES: ATP phosphoribosyltransferase [Chryseobacterium group]MBV6878244.1 ATP phosphoribosyltransferase [Epilithonimonas sp. FP105]MDW8547515.1 ATP phosphoribosyltransferase [Epilithonimonas ginsengisoli]
MSKLKLALQKSGRLSEKSLKLLEECGIKISNGTRKLKAVSSNFPLEILFLRDDDIPQYVEQGVADIGILGLNEVLEQQKQIETIQKLGFAQCRLSLAIPKEEGYSGIQYFENKKIATSYPEILSNYFQEKNINAQIEKIGGSVEIAPGIGLSDAIFDIISTGSTLLTNGLKEVEIVVESEAVLVSNNDLSDDKQEILKKLLFRINAVKAASESKYILLNAPNENVEKIINILPGMKSPTILPLAESGWSSIHSVIKEDQFWEVIEKLKNEGAQGILVLEIEKMIL